ncbi:HAD-IC family P-type ATPase [Candidatus Peregrinibacteria bacterium]|nr:HAD-IC family P-type ATPase [Candidatus Peregrinibacteria bacterium]
MSSALISLRGLSSLEAEKLQKEYGLNVLPHKKSDTWWKKILRQFSDLMVIILMISALVAFVLGERIDGSIIAAIVILNACIGIFQEWKSEKTLEALQKIVSPEAIVFRDGREQKVHAKFLVPGDIVMLREGDKIPADGKILEDSEIKVEESALTGESYPIEKGEGNEVFLGTAVVYGSGKMQVLKTGGATQFGNIAHLTLSTQSEKSPLEKELGHIGIFVGKIAIVLILVVFGLDFIFKKSNFLESLLFSISVAVAAVPEGLPATITIALALGVQRLAKKKAVVKQLSSVETLGATTVICSDKTGTLTKNEMTVREGFLSSSTPVVFQGEGWHLDGNIVFERGNPVKCISHLQEILEIAQNCNDAKIEISKSDGKVELFGDPTEGALLVTAEKFLKNFPEKKILPLPILKKFPFDAERKMMSSVHRQNESEKTIFVKGAAEMVLEVCTSYWSGEKEERLTPQKRTEFLQAVSFLSVKALRVLAFAKKSFEGKDIPLQAKDAENGLVFYGLLGMIDPPRKEVHAAVRAAHMAGIRTIIITGDNAETAVAVAREIGILSEKDAIILTSSDLQKLSDAELSAKLFEKIPKKNIPREILFARSTPADKMRIVSLLQEKGEIVAVTGDGVNDAPALKKANIGVAMGITGTEVSKETANMVLLDDSFATIVSAIREGRTIFENLKKFIWFLFASNISELIIVMTSLILSIPNPLTAVLILMVNLGTDALPAIALSFEKTEEGIMHVPPRNSNARILQKYFVLHLFWIGLVLSASAFLVLFWILFTNEWTWGAEVSPHLSEKIRSMVFSTIVIGQLFTAFSARHILHSAFQKPFENKFLLIALFISLLMVAAMLYIPPLHPFFKTTSLTLEEGILVLFASSLVLWVEEIRKKFMSREHPEF